VTLLGNKILLPFGVTRFFIFQADAAGAHYCELLFARRVTALGPCGENIRDPIGVPGVTVVRTLRVNCFLVDKRLWK